MKQAHRRTNVIVMGAMSLVMLVAMMGVVLSGVTQVTEGVKVAVVEEREAGSDVTTENNARGSDSQQIAYTNEGGYQQPLGETSTTGPDKTHAYAVVTNIQLAMLGVVGIGIVAVFLMMWQSSRSE